MVTGGDCSCADTTEPSNLTSLRSDDATSVINSDVNAICTETIDRNDAVEEPKGIFIHFFQTFYKSKLYIYIKRLKITLNIFLTAESLACQFFFLKNVNT